MIIFFKIDFLNQETGLFALLLLINKKDRNDCCKK